MGKRFIIIGADFSQNAIGTASRCATPIISSTRIDKDTISISLSTDTDGANIYYTTDGTAPSSNSMLYTVPFNITESKTIKAIAIKNLYLDSNILIEDVQLVTYSHLLSIASQNVNDSSITLQPSGTRAATLDYFLNGIHVQSPFSDNAYVHAYDASGIFLGIAGTSINAAVPFVTNVAKSVNDIIQGFSWYYPLTTSDVTNNVRTNAAKIRIVFSNVGNAGQSIYSY